MNVKQAFELFVPFVKIRSIIIMLVAFISLIVSGLGVVGVPYLATAQNTSSSSATPLMTMVDGIQCNVREQRH